MKQAGKMDCTKLSTLIEWFSTNTLKKVEQTLYISKYSYFNCTCPVSSKEGNVSNLRFVGPGLNNIKEIWRNECIQEVDWFEGRDLFLRV